ncbi:hypothetical protein HK097_006850 [Rhizophlyctis rosea]|uniref:Avian adenovirus fibre N-terminal domain-containing protein n=1 Tax=Rhizophlyctis rosea TaxID=64517 RepID=A0AAD5SFJ5_9FUNG|nr:hypothetical protein HK097_006850 [Rhizophlyctis rosea]
MPQAPLPPAYQRLENPNRSRPRITGRLTPAQTAARIIERRNQPENRIVQLPEISAAHAYDTRPAVPELRVRDEGWYMQGIDDAPKPGQKRKGARLDPIKIEWDQQKNPNDTLGGTLFLDYEEDDFNIEDGKLKSVPLNITGQGAIDVRKADWSLGEDDTKLRVVHLDVSEDFQQTGGRIAIRNQGNGRVPFFQIGSGLSSNGLFTFDGAQTLFVPYVKLLQSFLLPNDYAASVAFVHFAYQSGMETSIDTSEPISNRRVVRLRTDPQTLFINAANNAEVRLDPTGSLKKDVSGINLLINPTGGIFNTPGVGVRLKVDVSGAVMLDPTANYALDVRVDGVSVKKTAGTLNVNLSETDRGLQQLADGLGVRTQTMDPIKSGFDGLFLQLSPDDSCLAKTTSGLEVMVSPDSPLRKEILGLDVALNPDMTLIKTLAGLGGNYKGEAPDITVAGNMIICNITATGKLQKVGSVISMVPEVEEANDKADDLADSLDDVTSKLDDAIGDITDMTGQIDNLANNLASVAENVMSTSAQMGTAAAAGAVGGGVSSGLALTAAGKMAQNGIQTLISQNAAKDIGGGLAAASLAGVLGGLLGALSGKKTYNTYVIGDQGISNSGVPEGGTEPVWGYSISQGYNWD